MTPSKGKRRYVVAPLIGGTRAHVEITSEEFRKIEEAVQALLHSVDIEEKFDGIIESYIDFERLVFNQSLRTLIGNPVDDVSAQEFRTQVAGKLSNFLSSVRLYQHSIKRHAKHVLNDKAALSKFDAEVAKENADEIVKVMNGLRNYAQHFALAVHGYLLDRRRSSDGAFLEFEFKPHVYKHDLAKDRDFETILGQLPNLPDQLEIKPMVRSYVESLGRIHLIFRATTHFPLRGHHQHILKIRERVEDAIQLKADLLAAFEVDENGSEIGKRTNFLKSLDDYLRFLHGKNSDFAGFANRRIVY